MNAHNRKVSKSFKVVTIFFLNEIFFNKIIFLQIHTHDTLAK
jgi:hypothetical protein